MVIYQNFSFVNGASWTESSPDRWEAKQSNLCTNATERRICAKYLLLFEHRMTVINRSTETNNKYCWKTCFHTPPYSSCDKIRVSQLSQPETHSHTHSRNTAKRICHNDKLFTCETVVCHIYFQITTSTTTRTFEPTERNRNRHEQSGTILRVFDQLRHYARKLCPTPTHLNRPKWQILHAVLNTSGPLFVWIIAGFIIKINPKYSVSIKYILLSSAKSNMYLRFY